MGWGNIPAGSAEVSAEDLSDDGLSEGDLSEEDWSEGGLLALPSGVVDGPNSTAGVSCCPETMPDQTGTKSSTSAMESAARSLLACLCENGWPRDVMGKVCTLYPALVNRMLLGN